MLYKDTLWQYYTRYTYGTRNYCYSGLQWICFVSKGRLSSSVMTVGSFFSLAFPVDWFVLGCICVPELCVFVFRVTDASSVSTQ